MSQRVIPQPILSQIMKEIEQYDEHATKEKIAEILWKHAPKIALWYVIKEEIPY